MDVRPTKRQLEFQSWELGVFIHFGVRTFYEGNKDCDGKTMDPKRFNPAELDCGQWARTVKDAGGRYMVMTAKHHCGFANWPSAYTKFSVESSGWKNGKGDVVLEFVDACRENGLKTGIYYSPYDVDSPVYDDPKAYDDYFINQMTELFGGEYGDIDMVWFDGAHSENHEYDWPRIIREIRGMQPNILMFNMGDPDYRWCGNEDGFAKHPNWNVVDSLDFSILTDEMERCARGARWLSQECDFRIRDPEWFYSENNEKTLKSSLELLGNYYYTVGRGANLLLNIAPDRRGLLPEPDCGALLGMGTEIKRRFETPLFSMDDFQREENVWRHDGGCEGKWAGSYLVDHLVIKENLSKGESVRKFRISVLNLHYGKPITVFEGYNIGNKAICQFPPARCRGILFEVLEADGPVNIDSINAYSTIAS